MLDGLKSGLDESGLGKKRAGKKKRQPGFYGLPRSCDMEFLFWLDDAKGLDVARMSGRLVVCRFCRLAGLWVDGLAVL
jgi:hypothetical protein